MKGGGSGTKARFASSMGWMMLSGLLLLLLMVVPVHGEFQPANRTELKTGVDA